ncbi:MAG: acyltransferase [Candidatus Roizmanbacteria bacterium]|nr:MAG: acyltransferase [Candidatus Roizmanbacteria bacterium]
MKLLYYIFSIPARLKGMKIGKGSTIGPFYDFLFNDFSNVILGKKVNIGAHAYINPIKNKKTKPKIMIEDGTNIGRYSTLSCVKEINIGKNCLIGYNVSFLDHDHELYDMKKTPVTNGLTDGEKIIIENDCFIGAHSFILKGVNLGKRCIVGANSVVTKSFPAYSVIAGNPAKLLKKLKNK